MAGTTAGDGVILEVDCRTLPQSSWQAGAGQGVQPVEPPYRMCVQPEWILDIEQTQEESHVQDSVTRTD
jgi:hypothetical protein